MIALTRKARRARREREELAVLAALATGSCTVAILHDRLDWAPSHLHLILARLELAGQVGSIPDELDGHRRYEVRIGWQRLGLDRLHAQHLRTVQLLGLQRERMKTMTEEIRELRQAVDRFTAAEEVQLGLVGVCQSCRGDEHGDCEGNTDAEACVCGCAVWQDWWFTFGSGQHHPVSGLDLMGWFVVIHGTALGARREMAARFGVGWSHQYPSEIDAGVGEFRLRQLHGNAALGLLAAPAPQPVGGGEADDTLVLPRVDDGGEAA